MFTVCDAWKSAFTSFLVQNDVDEVSKTGYGSVLSMMTYDS